MAMQKAIKDVRAKLIEARNAYKAVETERNVLISEYRDKGWDIEDLAAAFGMKEANVEEAIRRVKAM